jgi:hypothetical protein
MSIIDSSSYSILNAGTVISILTSSAVQKNKNYPHIRDSFFNIKKLSENRILILVKPAYTSNIEKIFDDIAKLFSVDVLLQKKKVFTTSEVSNIVGVDFILNLQRQAKNIKILFKSSKSPIKEKLPELLRPGVLNEEYFTSVINDAIFKLDESKNEVGLPRIFNPRLMLGIYENNKKKYIIGPIKSIKRIGQELEKTDVRMKTDKKDINISLKKQNFSFWSSASQYKPAKNIIEYLINSNQIEISKGSTGKPKIKNLITGEEILGIKLPATIGEIKKYCFGENQNEIDFILINSYNPGDFRELRKTGMGGEDYKLDLNSSIVYTNKSSDIIRMRDDVYLTIVPSSSKNSSALMPEYPGFKIHFQNKKSTEKFFQPKLNSISLQRI